MCHFLNPCAEISTITWLLQQTFMAYQLHTKLILCAESPDKDISVTISERGFFLEEKKTASSRFPCLLKSIFREYLKSAGSSQLCKFPHQLPFLATTDLFFPFQDFNLMLHLPYPFPTPARKMEYKALPENSFPEESKPSSIMQPFDTIDVEKSAVVSSSGYGTISPYTNKEGGLRTLRKEQGQGIWISFFQSLVAVGIFTAMGVILVLAIL